jgi:hypothetical protein
MIEQFHPQPENPKQHAPEAGAGPLGLPPPPSPEQPQEGGSNTPEFVSQQPQKESTADNPTAQKKIEQSRLTKQSRATFENCIVSLLMPSASRVEQMHAEGLITGEQAVAEKKRALLRERHYKLGDRVVAIRNMLDRGRLPAEERRSLRTEYKNLKKEMRRIRREQREDD